MAAASDPYAAVDDDDYIKVAATEGEEFMEIPKEDDGTVMLSTIQTQFPDAIGLKCKGSSGAWRAIRAADNVLAAPKGGWGEKIYFVTLSETRKRKSEPSEVQERKRPASNPYSKDMAVIGLPYKTSTEELKEYFEKNYGETAYCEVKYDRSTGKSRGFGFVRFKDVESAKEAADTEHYMEGRKVEVKVKLDRPMKMFIGRLPHEVTKEDLEEYFSKFGELTDVYIPTPFRNFAFITYASTDDGQAVLRETHELNGARLNVEERKPDMRGGGNDNDRDRDRDRGGRDRDRSRDHDRDRGRDRDRERDRGRSDRDRDGERDRGANSGSGGGYTTREYQQAKYGEQRSSDPSGDLKTMLFEFLTKAT